MVVRFNGFSGTLETLQIKNKNKTKQNKNGNTGNETLTETEHAEQNIMEPNKIINRNEIN